MIDFPEIQDLIKPNDSKIVMLVVDGLGGLYHPDYRKTELEYANIPEIDNLAKQSDCGLTLPVLPGITPGSGPGHLSLFGYDPIKYTIGRGILEAIGISLSLSSSDIAARGNLCTIDGQTGLIIDRRAGRINSDEAKLIIEKLDGLKYKDVEIEVHHVREHRFVLLLKGDGLGNNVTGTDPEIEGKAPMDSIANDTDSVLTSECINYFNKEIRTILADRKIANMALLRGFSKIPNYPDISRKYQMKCAAIAAYPMYKGLAKLIGMSVLDAGNSFESEIETLHNNYDKFDFFFLHYKPADAAGEDGDFKQKVKSLEYLDGILADILSVNPDTFILAGDHSTPTIMASHSWHPVPFLINSKLTSGAGIQKFTENECRGGAIGNIHATHLMLFALAHSGRLNKFGP